jgi:hypothetical protein
MNNIMKKWEREKETAEKRLIQEITNLNSSLI